MAPRFDFVLTTERLYLLVGFGSQLLLLLLLAFAGHGLIALPIAFFGAIGLLNRWDTAPIFVLLILAGLVLNDVFFFLSVPTNDIENLFIAVAVLGYTGAQYRVCSPFHRSTPPPPRPNDPTEVPHWLMTLPFWVLAGVLLWERLPSHPGELRNLLLTYWPATWVTVQMTHSALPWLGDVFSGDETSWRLLFVIWFLGGGLLVGSGLLSHVIWRHATPAEAAMHLLDVSWRETRREQQRGHHWRTWARRRSKGAR